MKKIIIILLSIFILFSCNKNIEKNIEIKKETHIKTPKKVESLYYSASGITNKKKFDNLLNIAKNTSINSVIIDIKEID